MKNKNHQKEQINVGTYRVKEDEQVSILQKKVETKQEMSTETVVCLCVS